MGSDAYQRIRHPLKGGDGFMGERYSRWVMRPFGSLGFGASRGCKALRAGALRLKGHPLAGAWTEPTDDRHPLPPGGRFTCLA